MSNRKIILAIVKGGKEGMCVNENLLGYKILRALRILKNTSLKVTCVMEIQNRFPLCLLLPNTTLAYHIDLGLLCEPNIKLGCV